MMNNNFLYPLNKMIGRKGGGGRFNFRARPLSGDTRVEEKKDYLQETSRKRRQPAVGFDTLDDEMSTEEKTFMAELHGNVLDAGCGFLFHYAYYERGLANGKIRTFHGFDPNNSLKFITKRIPPKLKHRFILEVNTLEKIEFTRQYDRIIMRYVFSHFLEHKKCLKKLHACLKNKGTIYFIDGANSGAKMTGLAANIKSGYSAKSDAFRVKSTVERNLKVHLSRYRQFLTPEEFEGFEAETLDFYLNEPPGKHYHAREIIALFEENGFKIIRGLEGRAFGENSLQLIIGKK